MQIDCNNLCFASAEFFFHRVAFFQFHLNILLGKNANIIFDLIHCLLAFQHNRFCVEWNILVYGKIDECRYWTLLILKSDSKTCIYRPFYIPLPLLFRLQLEIYATTWSFWFKLYLVWQIWTISHEENKGLFFLKNKTRLDPLPPPVPLHVHT